MNFLKELLKLFTGIIAIVLCVVIFTLELGLHLVVDTKSYLSEKNIKNMVRDIDVDILLKDDNGEKTDLAKELYNSFDGISEEGANKILSSKSFKDLVGTYIGSSIESILYDTPVKRITVDDIIEIIEENSFVMDEVAEQEGYVLTEQDKEKLIESIRNSDLESVLEEQPDIGAELVAEDNEFKEIIDIVKKVYNLKTILLVVSVIIVLVLIIALIRFSLYSWMMWLSIPTMISSILILVFAIMIKPILGLFSLDVEILTFVTNNILPSLFGKLLISGIIGLVISIGLVIGYSILKRKTKQEVIS